jgi:hypothetical protein
MTTIPKSREQQINFFEQHLAVWVNDPASIGVTSAAITELNGLTQAARSSFVTVQATRDAAKAATTGYYGATDAMREAGGDVINTIRAFADGADDPASVYEAAQIPPRAAPSPAPAPDAPTNITTTVYTTGEVELKWKVKQPRPGAEIFTVIYRRLNNAGPYAEFTSTGEKMFVDSTIPAGTQSVSYMLRTRRGDQVSVPSDAVTQHLGVPGNGAQQQGLTLAA